jgi:gluconolactonase
MEQVATGYGLIEGPVWDAAKGCLYFSDVPNGGIHRLDAASGRIEVALERRRGVGGMALHEKGGLVFSGRDISWSPLNGGEGKILLGKDVTETSIGFNDLTTDREGRIYVGSLAFAVFGGGEPKPGHLHVIDLDGSVRTVSDGIMLTNGLGVSPDGTRLYHSDSRSERVRVYPLSAGGDVGAWETFAAFPSGSVPDGLKVAEDGSVWVADARKGRVAVFNPDGSHKDDIAVALPMVTSLCWGGADLRDLYIVTGSDGSGGDANGGIYRLRTDVPGLPLHPARVAL